MRLPAVRKSQSLISNWNFDSIKKIIPNNEWNALKTLWRDNCHRVFSHDVKAAILVSQNNETVAMLVSQTNPLGVELFSYANAFFCSKKLHRCWPREWKHSIKTCQTSNAWRRNMSRSRERRSCESRKERAKTTFAARTQILNIFQIIIMGSRGSS